MTDDANELSVFGYTLAYGPCGARLALAAKPGKPGEALGKLAKLHVALLNNDERAMIMTMMVTMMRLICIIIHRDARSLT